MKISAKSMRDNSTAASSEKLAPPSPWSAWKEARMILESLHGFYFLFTNRRKSNAPRHVVVIPGYGANDLLTWPLRQCIKQAGHFVEGWGFGVNQAGLDTPHSLADLPPTWHVTPNPSYHGEASIPIISYRVGSRLKEKYGEKGHKIVLIGWSLGGNIAREIARDFPELVEHVITLGTAVIGGPKYTAVADIFKRKGMDLDWIENEIAKREKTPIQSKLTAIISNSDAVVAWQASIDRHNRQVDHIVVNSSHIGLCNNPVVWGHLLRTLE